MKRAIAVQLITLAVHAAAHLPCGITLNCARAERNVIRIGINASASRSGVPGYRPTLHSKSSVELFATLRAGIDYAHAAALAIGRHCVVFNLPALHSELGVAFNVNCPRRIKDSLNLAALITRNLATDHLESGSLVFTTVVTISHHRTATITAVPLNTTPAHVKAGITHQHDAGRCKVISIAYPEDKAIAAYDAALHGHASAVGYTNSTGIYTANLTLLNRTAKHS